MIFFSKFFKKVENEKGSENLEKEDKNLEKENSEDEEIDNFDSFEKFDPKELHQKTMRELRLRQQTLSETLNELSSIRMEILALTNNGDGNE